MPIWLRRFTFNTINEFYENERKEYDKATGKGELLTEKTKTFKSPILDLPEAKPTYSTKVSRPNIPNPAVNTKAIYNPKTGKK